MSHAPDIPDNEKSIWEKSSTMKLIWIVLIVGCGLSALLGFVLAAQHKLGHDPHFYDKTGFAGFLGGIADGFPVFYGLVGFLAFGFIVLAGQHLRAILMRDEHYYDGPDDQPIVRIDGAEGEDS